MDPVFQLYEDDDTCYVPPQDVEVAGDNDYYARKWAAMPPVPEAVMRMLRAHALPDGAKVEES